MAIGNLTVNIDTSEFEKALGRIRDKLDAMTSSAVLAGHSFAGLTTAVANFGDAGKTYVQGLPDISGQISGFWDNDETFAYGSGGSDWNSLGQTWSTLTVTDAPATYFMPGPAPCPCCANRKRRLARQRRPKPLPKGRAIDLKGDIV